MEDGAVPVWPQTNPLPGARRSILGKASGRCDGYSGARAVTQGRSGLRRLPLVDILVARLLCRTGSPLESTFLLPSGDLGPHHFRSDGGQSARMNFLVIAPHPDD